MRWWTSWKIKIAQRMLESRSWNTKLRGARVLGISNSPSAARILGDALKGYYDNPLKEEMFNSLVKIGYPAVDILVGVLKDGDVIARCRAAEALGMIGNPKAVKPLIDVLYDQLVRSEATSSLCKIGDRNAIESLVTILADGAESTALSAAEILQSLGWLPENVSQQVQLSMLRREWSEIARLGPTAIDPLCSAFEQANTEKKVAIIRVIGEIGGERSISIISNILQVDKNPDIRLAAAAALQFINDNRTFFPLDMALKNDTNNGVRKAAAIALKGLGTKEAIKSLQNALCVQIPEVARAIAEILAEISQETGDTRVIEPLLLHSDMRITITAVKCFLAQNQPVNYGQIADAAFSHADLELCCELVDIFAGDRAALPVIESYVDKLSSMFDIEMERQRADVVSLEESVKRQKSAMAGWSAAGVDPYVNTDYMTSERQWEEEHKELDELESRLATARNKMDRLIQRRDDILARLAS